jgi:hypothetical protein
MDRKAFTRVGGLGVFSVTGGIWAWLAKADEAGGVFAMLSAVVPFLAEWGWIACFGFALAFLFWGDPTGWFGNLQKPRNEFVPLSEITRFMARDSIWLLGRDEQIDAALWQDDLRRDLIDALGCAEIAARGRKPGPQGGKSLYAMEAIPPAFWGQNQTMIMAVAPRYAPHDRVMAVDGGGFKDAYIDVRLNVKDVRRKWRSLLPWERPTKTPWGHAEEQERKLHGSQ